MNFIQVVTTLGLIVTTLAVPALKTVTSDGDAMDYLRRFGYMPTLSNELGELQHFDIEKAITQFQLMAGIKPTGMLDGETVRMMNEPRCGVPDADTESTSRTRRYLVQGSKWAKKDLTYMITRYTPDMPKHLVDMEIAKAFQVWSDVTPLKFSQRASKPVDIEIYFAHGDHGDGYPFDSAYGTLAHAFFPKHKGGTHFDEAETWTLDTDDGINLFQVAAHEFGHALGLHHSRDNAALMAPFYKGFEPDFKLHADDVAGIRDVYGAQTSTTTTTIPTTTTTEPTTTSTNPTTTTTTTKPPTTSTLASTTSTKQTTTTQKPTVPPRFPICSDPAPDAIVRANQGIMYLFKGEFYYEFTHDGVIAHEPYYIRDDWVGLPDNIDAAFHWESNGFTYFFKGDKYYRFSNKKMSAGYPKTIGEEDFLGIPHDLDAAFVWGRNGKTYFVKGDQYWRYSYGYADSGYPKPLSIWTGLPQTIDAAMQWSNGRTYFFEGDNYYRFNDVHSRVDVDYPHSTRTWWYGCHTVEKMNELVHNSAIESSEDGNAVNTEAKRTLDSEEMSDDNVMVTDKAFDSMDNAGGYIKSHILFTSLSLVLTAAMYLG